MERRYILFFSIALAIVISSQVLQSWLYPPPPVAPGELPPVELAAAREAEPAAEEPDAVADAVPAGDVPPRQRLTIGSLDPADPSRFLVTLSSRGAAIERIELADERFHDQDDRSGYLGHLAAEAVAEGCRIGVVGKATPADLGGLRAGDIIVSVAGAATADPAALADVLADTRPGQRVAVAVLRDGNRQECEVTLGRRPL